VAGARSNAEVDKVLSSLVKCFGDADARSLMAVNYQRLRTLGGELGVTRVKIDEEAGVVDFDVDAEQAGVARLTACT
jgi:hypothetical protein